MTSFDNSPMNSPFKPFNPPKDNFKSPPRRSVRLYENEVFAAGPPAVVHKERIQGRRLFENVEKVPVNLPE